MSLELKHVSRRFGNSPAVQNVSLDIAPGELVALLGPSGCGKTTLLRIIAGLETADSGSVYFNGVDTTGVDVRHRRVGFVFQQYALFRHMSVFENVAFGLRVKPRSERPSESAIRKKVLSLLELVQLQGLAERRPNELSGGQRQRIALARALAVDPQVLLLDEPFGALDARVRKELRRWLRQLHDELHVTSVFVTHDQEEAMEVADRVVVMNSGRIEQVGTPRQVRDEPATPFVLTFLGEANVFDGHTIQGSWHGEGITLPAPGIAVSASLPAQAYVKPEALDLVPAQPDAPGIPVRIADVQLSGHSAHLSLLRLDTAQPLQALLPLQTYQALEHHETAQWLARPRQAHVFTQSA